MGFVYSAWDVVKKKMKIETTNGRKITKTTRPKMEKEKMAGKERKTEVKKEDGKASS